MKPSELRQVEASNFDSRYQHFASLTRRETSKNMESKIAFAVAVFTLITVLTCVVQISDNHRHRSRRSVVYEEYTEESPDAIAIDDIVFLGFASLLDHAGCGARLVCEVHTLNDDELDLTGQRLTDLFREKDAPPSVERLQTDPKATFEYAAFIGKHSPNDTEICAQVFNRCPVAAQDILDSLKE